LKLKKDIIYEKLRKAILDGEYKPGMKLPVELVFCKHLGVGKITLRSALERLEGNGLISRLPGKGTFVNSQSSEKDKFIAIHPNYDIDLTSPFYYILPGLKLRAEQSGCKLETCSFELLRSNPIASSIFNMRNSGYKGAFLMSNNYTGNEPEIQILKECRIPVIIPHGAKEDVDAGLFTVLRTDTKKAFAAGLKYLAKCGHTIIGTITAGSSNCLRGYSLEEYLALQKSLGMKSTSEYIQVRSLNDNLIGENVQKLLDLPQKPTAILCYSDFTAMHVYQYLNSKGINIPADISVLGCCGYPGGDLFSPPLTTIDFMYESIGIQAFDLMLRSHEWFEKKGKPQAIETPFFIDERKSVKRMD
jgi:GntR family transcriptional regulator, arabinose operon transcriptional repressor